MQGADRFAEIDEETYAILENVEECALESLPIVSTVGIHLPKNKGKAKLNEWHVQPTLNCTGACGGKRQPTFHCSASRPTIGHALRAARLAVETQHADCIRRATEAAPSPACSTPAFAVLSAAARAESHAALTEWFWREALWAQIHY